MEQRKRNNLTLSKKLEIIEKLESGATASSLCLQYGIKKQTVSDIKKKKEQIKKFTMVTCKTSTTDHRKRMKFAREAPVEEAMLLWCAQQRSRGVPVRVAELKSAAIELANSMNSSFKASNGWLWRFCKRHGISHKTRKKASDAPTEEKEIEMVAQKQEEVYSGYHFMTDDGIKNEVTCAENEVVAKVQNDIGNMDRRLQDEDGGVDNVEEELKVISSIDNLISFIDNSMDADVQAYYADFCNFRELIVKKQQLQSNCDDFSKAESIKMSAVTLDTVTPKPEFVDLSLIKEEENY